MLGRCRSLNLRIGIRCSGVSVAASALAAPVTWSGKKDARSKAWIIPTTSFQYSLPEVSAFSGRAMPLLIGRLRPAGSVQNSPNMVCRVEILCYQSSLSVKQPNSGELVLIKRVNQDKLPALNQKALITK